jgi:hypothetical protein
MFDTPGHTPECSVYIVSDLERGEEPAVAFTGDSLLVGMPEGPTFFRTSKKSWVAALQQPAEIEKIPTMSRFIRPMAPVRCAENLFHQSFPQP